MLRKINTLKTFILIAIFCLCVCENENVVQAKNIQEIEPNNQLETAELIEANMSTAEDTIDGNDSKNKYCIQGTTSIKDFDCFKVYLTKGTQYITIYGGAVDITLKYPDGRENTWNYVKNGMGSTGYKFIANETGYYYVWIKGTNSSSSSYNLYVGNPIYSIAYCKVELDSINMTSSGQNISRFDLSEEVNLPDDAMVYEIRMNNVRSTYVKSVDVTNVSSNITVNMPFYPWYKSKLAGMQIPLKSRWIIEYEYGKRVSFTPSVTLDFVYPNQEKYYGNVTIK